jgi:hypothetical protein
MAAIYEDIEEVVIFDQPLAAPAIAAIERYLISAGAILADFSKLPRTVCSVLTYLQQEVLHDTTTRILFDRQMFSYLKQIALGRSIANQDLKLASAIMCFASLCHFEIEPNIAIYEYADTNGNEEAWRDVCIFRHANKLGLSVWHSLFLGITKQLAKIEQFNEHTPLPPRRIDFQQKLRLFNFCLAFVLKLVVLERSAGSPVQRGGPHPLDRKTQKLS